MWAWVPWLCFNWDHFLDIIIFCLKDSRLVLNENTPFVSSSFIVQDEAYSNNDHESSVIRKPQLKISVPHLEGLTNGITIARVTRGRICDK